jgi:hypothetical protein
VTRLGNRQEDDGACVPHDVDGHLASIRHADVIAIDVEHFAVVDALVRETFGIRHVSS